MRGYLSSLSTSTYIKIITHERMNRHWCLESHKTTITVSIFGVTHGIAAVARHESEEISCGGGS